MCSAVIANNIAHSIKMLSFFKKGNLLDQNFNQSKGKFTIGHLCSAIC